MESQFIICPRQRGIREHLERARFFFSLSTKEEDAIAAYRLQLAAIYSCRAIVELMLEAAEKEEIPGIRDPDRGVRRKTLEAIIHPRIPYYALIERIRIHDFHRFGIAPPDPAFQIFSSFGPIKLVASAGTAVLSASKEGPERLTMGDSSIKEQRSLWMQDGNFFDDASGKYVSLTDVVSTFLSVADEVFIAFSHLCHPPEANPTR